MGFAEEMMNASDECDLVVAFERAVINASHLNRAYETLRLVPGTNNELTALYNLSEDAQAKRRRAKAALIEALKAKQ